LFLPLRDILVSSLEYFYESLKLSRTANVKGLGLKYKLAHKRVDKGKWSSTDNAQKEQLIRLFEGLIAQLKGEMVEAAK
jgi:hypothetical protein